MKTIVLSVLLTVLAFAPGCESKHPAVATPAVSTPMITTAMDKAAQTRMTPDQALARLVEGNRRFVANADLRRDYLAQVKATAGGQYPFAVVVACIDSRTAPEIIFDQGIGDLFVARVAGNYCPVDILGSMEYGAEEAGAKLIVVLGHTECGAIKGTCDNVELGNLTEVIHALRPALADVKETGDRSSKNHAFVRAVAEANVRRSVASIRANSPILRDMERAGKIKIVGGMYDVGTGEVTFLK